MRIKTTKPALPTSSEIGYGDQPDRGLFPGLLLRVRSDNLSTSTRKSSFRRCKSRGVDWVEEVPWHASAAGIASKRPTMGFAQNSVGLLPTNHTAEQVEVPPIEPWRRGGFPGWPSKFRVRGEA